MVLLIESFNRHYLKETQKTGFFCILARCSGFQGRCSDVGQISGRKCERTAIGRQTDDQLFFARSFAVPFADRKVDRQLFVEVACPGQGKQRRIVTDRLLPVSMKIVGHDVEKVQISGEKINQNQSFSACD